MNTLLDCVGCVGGDESGQTMAEYAVVLGLILMVTVVVFIVLGDTAASAISRTAQRILNLA